MKKLFLLSTLCISCNLYSATRIETCGTFDVYGEVKSSTPGHYMLVVNGGSMSEYKFNLSEAAQEKISVPYLDQDVKVRVVIKKKVEGYQGKFASIKKIEEAVPDPAHLGENHGFFLIKKEKCK